MTADWLLLAHDTHGAQQYCSATITARIDPFCGVPEDEEGA
jgi:hypothetical protein